MLFLLDGGGVLLLLLGRGAIVMHGDLFAKGDIDVFERALLGLGEEEEDVDPMDGGDADEDEEELPRDDVEGDGAGDQDDDAGRVQTDHADGHALGADVRREDLGQVQVLRGVHEGRPEEDEEEDEEDGGALARLVGGAEVLRLHGAFTGQRDEDAAEAGEEEDASADPVDEEGGENVAGE